MNIPFGLQATPIVDDAGNVSRQWLSWLTTLASQVSGSSSMVYPGAGVPKSTGAAWDTSYAVGTSANNLVQLNGSGELPAVSGANLTDLPEFSLSSTQNDVTASRAVDGTVYTNTSGKLMIVTVSVSGTDSVSCYTDANADPTLLVSRGNGPTSFTFCVLPGNKYKVSSSGTLDRWMEWTIG